IGQGDTAGFTDRPRQTRCRGPSTRWTLALTSPARRTFRLRERSGKRIHATGGCCKQGHNAFDHRSKQQAPSGDGASQFVGERRKNPAGSVALLGEVPLAQRTLRQEARNVSIDIRTDCLEYVEGS